MTNAIVIIVIINVWARRFPHVVSFVSRIHVNLLLCSNPSQSNSSPAGQATGHMIYIQFQGMIKHTLMALSEAGTQVRGGWMP